MPSLLLFRGNTDLYYEDFFSPIVIHNLHIVPNIICVEFWDHLKMHDKQLNFYSEQKWCRDNITEKEQAGMYLSHVFIKLKVCLVAVKSDFVFWVLLHTFLFCK